MAAAKTGLGGGFQFVTNTASAESSALAPRSKKHVVYISNIEPNKEYDTVLYTGYLMLRGLRDAGYEVTVLVLSLPAVSIASPEVRQRWRDELEAVGIGVKCETLSNGAAPPKKGIGKLTRPLRKLLLPKVKDHFPLIANAPKVAAVVEALKPDIAVYWGNFDTIAACVGIKKAPFVAIVGEPPHFPEWFRNRPPFVSSAYRFSFRFWRQSILILINRRLTLRLLKQCHTVWCTVTYLTQWYRSNGITDCQHIRNVVPDWGGPDWPARRAATAPTERLKIVLMGTVGGTSTLAGLHFLADEILPHLDALFADKFEIHICGSGKLPADLERKFQRPGVIRRGFVDDIVSELFSSDVFLVPTPIELGSRVRIAYAWSVGCCVVSHTANAVGLEEMKDGHNALLGTSGAEVAKAIIRTHQDPEMKQRLQKSGRETFERYYSESATVDKIITKVKDIIHASQLTPRSARTRP